MMKKWLFTAAAFLTSGIGAAAPTELAVRQALIESIGQIEHSQDPETGGLIELECGDKAMNQRCMKASSFFITSFALDALQTVPGGPRLDGIRSKALQFAREHQEAFGGLVKYYPRHNPMSLWMKYDVDDNAVGLATLASHGIKLEPSLLERIKIDGLRERTVPRKQGEGAFAGSIFTTWLKPTEPLFADLDVVVNANALWLFGQQGEISNGKDDELADVCRYLNTVVDWSAETPEWDEFYNTRQWNWIFTDNYSAWYPSPYVFAYTLARASTAGNQHCLAPAIEKVERLLTHKGSFELTPYDQAAGAAALLRLAEARIARGEDASHMIVHAGDLVEKLTERREPVATTGDQFFYYGAKGYIGSDALLNAFKAEALARYLRIALNPQREELSLDDIHASVSRGLEYFRKEQHPDGSWTHLIKVSSTMYAAFVIYMYEYMDLTTEKKPIIDGLMSYIWAQQNPSGAFSGYPGGPDSPSISAMMYITAKIAGANDDEPRMLKLEQYVNSQGGIHAVDFKSRPFLMLLGLDPTVHCLPRTGLTAALEMDNYLPWARVMAYPMIYMIASGNIHKMDESKHPRRLGTLKSSICKENGKQLFRLSKRGEQRYFQWTLDHLNPDGTLFDYTPTTVPTLMALSTKGKQYEPLVKKGIGTLESFQEKTPFGLFQSPGEASIGETYVIINALLDLGLPIDDPMLANSEKFMYSVMQPTTGAFGFSKNNLYFPDSDDTSNSIYVLKRMAMARGDEQADEKFRKGLDWLVSVQNYDGGFGTWEKQKLPPVDHLIQRMAGNGGVVLSESVTEHTARIVLNLALFKDLDRRYQRAYERAVEWLLREQSADGSYPGTWFVDYLFGTSMVMTGLATAAGDPRVDAAIEKGLEYIVRQQQPDGGFSETPDSFIEGRSIPMERSSPAQTGLVVSQLFMFLREENYRHWEYLKPFLENAVRFLMETQGADGLWHDPTWSGVTFPKVEYLIYPYIQEISPIQAIGMHGRVLETQSNRN